MTKKLRNGFIGIMEFLIGTQGCKQTRKLSKAEWDKMLDEIPYRNTRDFQYRCNYKYNPMRGSVPVCRFLVNSYLAENGTKIVAIWNLHNDKVTLFQKR